MRSEVYAIIMCDGSSVQIGNMTRLSCNRSVAYLAESGILLCSVHGSLPPVIKQEKAVCSMPGSRPPYLNEACELRTTYTPEGENSGELIDQCRQRRGNRRQIHNTYTDDRYK